MNGVEAEKTRHIYRCLEEGGKERYQNVTYTCTESMHEFPAIVVFKWKLFF